jgi:hypothetical protein
MRLEASTKPHIHNFNSWIFDEYGLHNGLPKLQERPVNGLWSFRGYITIQISQDNINSNPT